MKNELTNAQIGLLTFLYKHGEQELSRATHDTARFGNEEITGQELARLQEDHFILWRGLRVELTRPARLLVHAEGWIDEPVSDCPHSRGSDPCYWPLIQRGHIFNPATKETTIWVSTWGTIVLASSDQNLYSCRLNGGAEFDGLSEQEALEVLWNRREQEDDISW